MVPVQPEDVVGGVLRWWLGGVANDVTGVVDGEASLQKPPSAARCKY
jgi:hypothetical protein